MKKTILTLLITLTASVSLAAVKYSFKPTAGTVEFKTKGWPSLITIKGKGEGVTGDLANTENKLSGTLTFNLDSLKTGIDLRDDHMKNNYLEVTKYPKATLTFKDASVSADLKGKVTLKAVLKLHDVEKDVEVKAKLTNKGDSLKVEGDLPIKITDYKIPVPNYKGITVAEKVSISFETSVTKN